MEKKDSLRCRTAAKMLSPVVPNGLAAPMVVDGAINGELFLAYTEQILLPTLREGDVVVMDNLSSHKVAGVEKAIQSVGA